MEKLKFEKMDDFFASRVENYDAHMLNDVEGVEAFYSLWTDFLKEPTNTLLDLGVGTGLELTAAYARFPLLKVVGVDLCKTMTAKATQKFGDKLSIVNGNFFDVEFGKNLDAVVSFEALHHFDKTEKRRLFKKIYKCLLRGGTFVLCDFYCFDKKESDKNFDALKKYRRESGDTSLVHFDTPLVLSDEIALLQSAGFCNVTIRRQIASTVLLTAQKY